ncbi:MAG: hypothetical protein OXU77_03515 [Gammaproteobacteria bacterium]|nr:hypothetical protein [Gammaproteobacteria bacterium]MDE0443495.1 hypothetical protein [Gammaproteobacteria bacterium]
MTLNADDRFWMQQLTSESEGVMSLWRTYIIIVAVIVGFLASAKPSLDQRFFIAALFLIVAVYNLVPMYLAQVRVEKISCMLTKSGNVDSALARRSKPEQLVGLHILVDAAVVVFVLWP